MCLPDGVRDDVISWKQCGGFGTEVDAPRSGVRLRTRLYLTTDFEQASLLPQRLKDQFALKTEAALANLTFIEGRHV